MFVTICTNEYWHCNKMEEFDADALEKNITESFNLEVLKEAFKYYAKDSKTRVTDDTIRLVAIILQKLVIEATLRAGKQAWREGQTTIQLEHVEKILPLLMLDFS